MFDFLAEYMLLAFALGGILGAAIASHLVVRHQRSTTVVTGRDSRDPRAGDLAPARVTRNRTR